MCNLGFFFNFRAATYAISAKTKNDNSEIAALKMKTPKKVLKLPKTVHPFNLQQSCQVYGSILLSLSVIFSGSSFVA